MPYINKINQCYLNKNTAEAKRVLEIAIKENDDFYLYHERLGDLLVQENDIKQARICYERALELNSSAEWIKLKTSLLIKNSDTVKRDTKLVGIYDKYPDLTGKRQGEGGRRINGELKFSKPNMPLVTIVTVVYNNENMLQRCINSVRQQSYSNVEYIIIDGGSDDGTLKVIRDNLNIIDYFISEPDSGIYSAMNKGLELAKGEYICLLNSDDFYSPEFLSKTIEAAKHYRDKVDIIYTDYFSGANLLRAQEINEGVLFGHLNICHNTFLATKDCYDRIGRFDENFKIVSDAIWIRKAFTGGINFKCIREPLFTLSDGGLSSGNSEKRRNLFISEVVESYQRNFSFLLASEAEEIYLFRFNKNRAFALRSIVMKYKNRPQFFEAMKRYVEHCLRDRSNFLLSHTESDSAFVELCKLVEVVNGNLKCIQINTKHGLFSDVLSKIDSILELRKKNARKTILHFVSVFSAASEAFIYDLLTRLENETIYDNYILFEHEQLREQRPYAKAIHVPWGDFRPEIATQIYKYVIENLGVSVVVAHFSLNEWKFSTRIKPLFLSIPTISMTHGIDVFSLRDKLDYKKYILDEFCSRPDTIFTTVSQYLRAELLSHGVPSDKVVLLHNTVNAQFFNHRKSSGFYEPTNTLKLLSVGRLVEWKGHEFAIRALKIFKDTCTPDVHLTIVYGNSGDLLEYTETLIRETGLEQNVSLVPFVNFKERPDYYSNFDCFVHPSTYSSNQYQQSETFGVAVLEAIAAGLPVITTDAGGLPEVIGEETKFAKIVPHANSIAIAEALSEFWRSREAFADNKAYSENRLKIFSPRAQITKLSALICQVTSMPIRAALFSTSTIQGAGYAAYRLHKGLRAVPDHSVVTTLFTTVRNHESESDINVITHPSGNNANWQGFQLQAKPDHTIFTINQRNISSYDLVNMVRDFDIINLHWYARFLSVENIATLTRLGKPVVMTIRDMYPITGGCHFFHGCTLWKTNCYGCPQIPSDQIEYPSKVLAAKRDRYKFSNLTIVVLSAHSRRIIESTPFFNKCRIEVIPNSIETDVFQPYDRVQARNKLGLPVDKKIIGYVPSYSSSVKGYKEIVKAFDILKNTDMSKNLFVMLVGNETPATSQINLDKQYLGYISDNDKLALAYSAADVIVVPSLEETFSNTAAEAISCGVPVVGFRTGAIPDLALDGITGYTFEVGDVKGLVSGIERVLNGSSLREQCRTHALSYLDFMKQANRYELLFHELIAFQTLGSSQDDELEVIKQIDELDVDIV
ncbi:glycosyltransferase [Methylomonas sp. MgM2]